VVEPAVRHLAAELLGVGSEDLRPDVSLTDDLAADSLDLVELALAVEREWGLAIPDRTLQALRTYGDLVDAVTACVLSAPAGADVAPVFARTRVIPGGDASRGRLERSGELTPYAAELLADDARRAGPGTRIEMELPAVTDDTALAAAFRRLGRLSARGVQVSVRRSRRPPAA
jgi:acyl carrier protein